MTGIKIPVEAQFDAGDLARATDQFVQQVNKMGAAVAKANKLKYSPIDKASIDNMRQFQEQVGSLLNISKKLSERIKVTGQGGRGFFDLDWNKLYDDPSARARAMRKAFDYTTSPFGPRLTAPPAPAPAQPPRHEITSVPGRQHVAPQGDAWRQAGRNIIGAGLNAAGPAGGVANGALSAGMSGGLMAGVAGLAGGLLALGISKAVGGVLSRVGSAGEEFTRYDTLKRTLGDVNVSFGVLRDSLRASSKEIDVTFQEGQKLGTEFARIAGYASDRSLAQEVAIGGGFSRSFGLDPAQGNTFFAQMRQFQVTGNEQDSRRLALLIGESIGKSGAFAKADEILQAIGSFAAQQTRLGLVSANVGGYAAMLSGMVGSRTPGLDVQGSASILSRVNAAISSGGGAGEAGQNFLYMALGKRLGLDPIQARILQEQGAFGTGADAFGDGSVYARFAERYRIPGAAGGASSRQTNLQMVMNELRRQYAGRPELMASAMSNLFGINTSQAMALAIQAPDDLGRISSRLNGSGFDLAKLSPTGIAALAQIDSGGRDVLEAQATSLRKRTGVDALSDSERRDLDAALKGGDDEKLRDILTKLTASREQEKTDGSETRRATIGILNLQQELAGKLVPIFNDMRAGILYLAGDRGKMGPMGIRRAMMEAESNERKEAIGADYDDRIKRAGADALGAKDAFQKAWEDFRQNGSSMSPEQQEATRANLKKLADARDAAAQRVRDIAADRSKALEEEDARFKNESDALRQPMADSPTGTAGGTMAGLPASSVAGGSGPASGNLRGSEWLMKQLAETDRILGLPSGTAAAQIDQESSFNPNALSKKGAMGLAQVMPQTLASLEKRLGRKLNPYDPADAVLIQRELMGENMRAFGNVNDALSAYNGGWDPGKWSNPETAGYVPSIMAKRGMYSTVIPGGSSAGGQSQAQPQQVNIQGTFTLNNPNGTPAAAPVQINTQVNKPTAFGAQQ